MAKGQMLRALVTQRLSAAAEEIFALFERTVLEYEEELCRSVEENWRKQRLLDTILSPTDPPHRAGSRVQIPSPSPPCLCSGSGPDPGPSPGPSPNVNQEIMTQTAQIKVEAEEQSVKQEEELLLQVPVPESNVVCVKTEELQQRQTEDVEGAQGEDTSSLLPSHTEIEGHSECSSDTDNADDWGAPFSCPDPHMDTEADGDHYNQITDAEYLHEHQTSAGVNRTTERKKHQCFICQKRFSSKILLQIHIRVHTGEKPYSCPICKKTFAQKNNLNAHRITHTGEKPYSCSLCKKTFGRNCTLKRHMKVHAAERPAPCHKGFSLSHDLTRQTTGPRNSSEFSVFCVGTNCDGL